MLNLPQKTLITIKRLLLRRQKKLEEELKSLDGTDPIKSDGVVESSEPGTDSWFAEVHGKVTALRQNISQLLISTRHALGNLKSGKYGRCEKCNKTIEVKRLLVMPTASLCLACSKKNNLYLAK